MSIATHNKFPEALTTIFPWLEKLDDTHYIVHQLQNSGLTVQFPKDALKLLGIIINKPTWIPKELRQCLNEISQTLPKLQENIQYKRLDDLIREQNN